jgi:hypothetical protein
MFATILYVRRRDARRHGEALIRQAVRYSVRDETPGGTVGYKIDWSQYAGQGDDRGQLQWGNVVNRDAEPRWNNSSFLQDQAHPAGFPDSVQATSDPTLDDWASGKWDVQFPWTEGEDD